MEHLDRLFLTPATRAELWDRLTAMIENYVTTVPGAPVSSRVGPERLRSRLAGLDFRQGMPPLDALEMAAEGLWGLQVHTPHPRYFGLFNPAPAIMGVAADALVAAFNPQLAAWSHSPWAVEVEQHLARAFTGRFGYDPAEADGTFCSGGAEANHTAVLAALSHTFPDFDRGGVRALPAQPIMYVSTEAHHSLLKAARLCGLGTEAVRPVGVDARLGLDPDALADRLRRDREAGLAPFMITATAGTTSAGAVDPITSLADLARRRNLWLHVDAAWGGAAALVPELRPLLEGIERADSITFDLHKWLSAPMGASLCLTRHPEILGKVFRFTTDYMPREASAAGTPDPYGHSMQWSRRFIGLKVFLTLAVAGWDGLAAAVRHMTAMGARLRRELDKAGWEAVNPTRLPVVCFVDTRTSTGRSLEYLQAVADHVVAAGAAWISTTRLRGDTPALRACITNYRTGIPDLEALVSALEDARRRLA